MAEIVPPSVISLPSFPRIDRDVGVGDSAHAWWPVRIVVGSRAPGMASTSKFTTWMGRMEWSTGPWVTGPYAQSAWAAGRPDPQSWTPVPLLWRATRTFRGRISGPQGDTVAGIPITLPEMEDWLRRMNVFPRLLNGALYTFEPPYWCAFESTLVQSTYGADGTPSVDLQRSMLTIQSLEGALASILAQHRRGMTHAIYELIRWAGANNPKLSVWLDNWQQTNALGGLSVAPTPGAIPLPTPQAIVQILRQHPLIRLKEKVKRVFLVGSFAKGTGRQRGSPEGESDVDVLLEVVPRRGFTAGELEEYYRQRLRSYFMQNNIRGKADEVHPQWDGRRVDVYFTYDANTETRPKVLLGHWSRN
mgnify:CR=1 FL=1